MIDSNNYVFSKIQSALLRITSIIFVVFLWRMLPVNEGLKLAICLVSYAIIYLLISLFVEFLYYFKLVTTPRSAVIITMIVFLLCPVAINVLHDVHEKEYIEGYPSDDKIYVQITSDINRVSSSGSIGSEWTYKHYLNRKEFKDGDILTVKVTAPFTITSCFIESDSIDDVGETTSREFKYSSNENYKKTLTVFQKVHVVEEGGRRNAGATADFNVTYTLKRVIPTSMGYWDLLFYTDNDLEFGLGVWLILGQILSIVTIAYVIIDGRKKQVLAEEEARIIKEQEKEKARRDQIMKRVKEFNAELRRQEEERIDLEIKRRKREEELLIEKNAFLESLQGQSIRQAAGVPSNITFINGLPKDNDGAQYGSFTVYCSNSGKCYHDKFGCCSARQPIHHFNATKMFKPCSKCCIKRRGIPPWYLNYTSLKTKAKYYKIDVPE